VQQTVAAWEGGDRSPSILSSALSGVSLALGTEPFVAGSLP
jgi:hypothetical protein